MLKNRYQNYGYGQQNYAMHQERYDMPNEHQSHVSGMQVSPDPCTESSQFAERQMFGGNHPSHEEGWQVKNKIPNGSYGKNVPYQCGWSTTTTAYYSHASGAKLPPPGGFRAPQFPQGYIPNNMMKNAEYETCNSCPEQMRVQAMKYQQGNWKNDSPGYQMDDEHDCYTPKGDYQKAYQEVEWKNQRAFPEVEWKNL